MLKELRFPLELQPVDHAKKWRAECRRLPGKYSWRRSWRSQRRQSAWTAKEILPFLERKIIPPTAAKTLAIRKAAAARRSVEAVTAKASMNPSVMKAATEAAMPPRSPAPRWRRKETQHKGNS